ncbi:MAG: hypothetical protein PWQ48_1877 [Thermotogaceae bacterium]|jgi:colanic acid/amylovoran biosynthesis protein|nr:hypothetical protein [Thermotogaceae bacterium]MDI3501743.1 hypothetical protein [Thermoanaerobacter sp.]
MRFFLEAYFDRNFGDDLMIHLLLEKFRDIEFVTNVRDKIFISDFLNYENFKVIFDRKHKAIKSCDGIIFIGGSIFQVHNYKHLYYHFKRLLIYYYAKLLGKHVVILGCNIGPVKIKAGWFIIKQIIKLADLITVRDRKSYEIVSKIKKKGNYFLFPDIVFSLEGSSLGKINNGNNQEILGVSVYRSVIYPEGNYNFCVQMSYLIDQYISRTGNNVRLFAFDSGHENDTLSAIEIFKLLKTSSKHKKVEIIIFDGNVFDFINKFSECSYIIGTRFHSIVLSMVQKIPCYPIIYSNKTENLLEDFGFSGKKYFGTN